MSSDEPTMLYYDADGKRVAADDPGAVRQFLSDDDARPDSGKKAPAVFGLSAAADDSDDDADDEDEAPADEKAQGEPPATKARKSSANK